jgi:hypothetical protein
MDPAPPILKEVVMNTAGKGMQMNGYIAGPFQVVLGTHLFTVAIYVVPIEEDMLLGLDFLETNGVSLHLKEKELQISGDVIPMSLGTGSPLVNEKEGTGLSPPLCNVRGINSSPLVAAFTIYSPAIDSLSCAPTLMTELGGTLHPLARNMNGYIAGPFQVVLGTHLFTVEIYVAPIEEDMLLGLDFLEANGVSLHLCRIPRTPVLPVLLYLLQLVTACLVPLLGP